MERTLTRAPPKERLIKLMDERKRGRLEIWTGRPLLTTQRKRAPARAVRNPVPSQVRRKRPMHSWHRSNWKTRRSLAEKRSLPQGQKSSSVGRKVRGRSQAGRETGLCSLFIPRLKCDQFQVVCFFPVVLGSFPFCPGLHEHFLVHRAAGDQDSLARKFGSVLRVD